MIHILQNGDNLTIIENPEILPDEYKSKVLSFDNLPEGSGNLRLKDGELYYESIELDIPVEPEVPVEPEPETNPQLQQIMEKLENQEFYNLTLMEMNMALYEEILALQDRLDNA